jgi:ankyrin repeat protein
LKKFIFDIVKYGDSLSLKALFWEDEDRDVVRAALDMGFEPDILSDSEGWIAADTPLLIIAVEANKIKVIELLIERKVNVNKTDTYGRTSLIVAAMNGNLECVKKLLTAGAVTWLCDGYDKYAIDYAQKYLLEASEADEKKEYEAIIELLESANNK